MSGLALLNYIVQLLFIRIVRCELTVIEGFELDDVIYGSEWCSANGRSTKSHKEYYYTLRYWILPFSGWFNYDFIFVGEKRDMIKITKNRIVK